MLTDAHGDRIRHARGHHERGRHNLQRDLVRGQLRAAHGAHAQGRKSKQPDFHRVGATDGQAEAPQFAQVRHVKPRQAFAQRIGVVGRVPMNMPGKPQRHARGHNRRHQADAHQPQFRQAEHAGNQRVIEQEVGHGADDANDHHGHRATHRTGKAAQSHERHVAGQCKRQ